VRFDLNPFEVIIPLKKVIRGMEMKESKKLAKLVEKTEKIIATE
jgi:hypothetical protein